MSIKARRGIVLLITVAVAAVWGFEISDLIGGGGISTLLSMVGGFIIGMVGYSLAEKITE